MDLGPKMYTLDRKYSKNLKIKQMCSFRKNITLSYIILDIIPDFKYIKQFTILFNKINRRHFLTFDI